MSMVSTANLPTKMANGNGIKKCYRGHSHLSTSWTIYVVDPACSHDVETYGEALSPIDAFDTKEQVETLYKLPAFKPGPPSWSMNVNGGAIAIFQGGKYGFPVVKPEWEDPASRNGSEFRFQFDPQTDPFLVLDKAFHALVTWMTGHELYEETRLLGLFVKNTNRPGNRDPASIQFRLWTSRMPDADIFRLARTIGNDMAEVLGKVGARGIINYKGLDNLIRRANATTQKEIEQDSKDMNAIRLKFFVPSRSPRMNGQEQNHGY
ncbi:uncharacterized protein LOC129581257 [Paramacrobiotus metropolitanus]|uniref:uncharacterized protein LOC129581257 n=1 Tax=Paramacrobiotus metropolitanus TaxID=2943436 RepID=UPI0024456CCC|nr:uncharacterized protein LOC129581257 [Paramacrobiotus metropolitanus]